MKGFFQSLPLAGRLFLAREIQPEEVWSFWRFMQTRFRTTSINKRDAIEMQLVARALDALGVLDGDRFMMSFTTTVGRRIYMPFEIGVPRFGWDLWSQVAVCVHEHQHVVQHDRDGMAYEIGYVFDRANRARYEAEAYRSNLELHFWRHGTTPSARRIAEVLSDYGCRPEDVDVAAKSLALSAVSVRKGAVINEATHVALGWLDGHVPRLRAKGVA